nr:MAG TPA: hypothetical protein [Caudoviricetes sp.]
MCYRKSYKVTEKIENIPMKEYNIVIKFHC